MKSCDEMVNSLFERRERFIAEKKIKKKKMISVVTTCCCLCIVVAIVFGVWQGDTLNAAPPTVSNGQTFNGDIEQTNSGEASDEVTDENKRPAKANGFVSAEKNTEKSPSSEDDSENEVIPDSVDATENTTKKNTKNNGDYDKNLVETETAADASTKWIEKIEITRLPDKKVYYLGDSFDLRGLQVMGYFTNGEVEDVTEDVQCYSETANSISNQYRINVEYTDSSEYVNLAYASFTVMVIEPKIQISDSSLTLNVGESSSLSAITEAMGCTISWHTTDSDVVTVDDYGNVTAVGAGTASVYAEISYNDFKKTSGYCQVTVEANG